MNYANDFSPQEIEEISRRVSYDPVTGAFTHKIDKPNSRYGKVRAGDPVSMKPDKGGYFRLCIKGNVYKAHRLAWLLTHGECPPDKQIDHIDHNKTNNAMSNLRLVDGSGNQRNRTKNSDNRSGVNGVCFVAAEGKWMAYYCRNIIGKFASKEEAIAARAAANKAHGFHQNHGRDRGQECSI